MYEYFSALTMLGPSIMATYYHWTYPFNLCMQGIYVGTLLHAPFSILYHVLCANQMLPDPINNLPRKMDQIMIHVAAICYTVSIVTNGTYLFWALTFNELCISYVAYAFSTSRQRRINILISILLYVLPIAYQHPWIGLNILVYIALGVTCFVYPYVFYGYGQGMFHLFLCGILYYIELYCMMECDRTALN